VVVRYEHFWIMAGEIRAYCKAKGLRVVVKDNADDRTCGFATAVPEDEPEYREWRISLSDVSTTANKRDVPYEGFSDEDKIKISRHLMNRHTRVAVAEHFSTGKLPEERAAFIPWLNKVLDLKLDKKYGLSMTMPGFPEPGEMNIASWREGRAIPHPRVLRGLLALLLLDEPQDNHPLYDEWSVLADMDVYKALPWRLGCPFPSHRSTPATLGHYVWEPAWSDLGEMLSKIPYEKREGFLRKMTVLAVQLAADRVGELAAQLEEK